MMRILALDVGEKRIGVAISDPLGLTARGLVVLQRSSKEKDFAAIAALVQEHQAERVIVGYPLSLDGSAGPQAQRIAHYAEALAQALEVPVELWDERLSTVDAERVLRETGVSRRRRKQRVDAVAAAAILQSYLEAQR